MLLHKFVKKDLNSSEAPISADSDSPCILALPFFEPMQPPITYFEVMIRFSWIKLLL